MSTPNQTVNDQTNDYGFTGVYRVWTMTIAGNQKVFKNFKFERKTDMNSPTEWSAKIVYDNTVQFMDPVVFYRDGTIEYKGYIEHIEIEWDDSGRYLNLKGRSNALILWKKYSQDFSNYVQKTAGFFGAISGMQLIQLLLRTPISDSIEDYPYNLEGWGMAVDRITNLSAMNTASGDPNNCKLRKRGYGWRNSGQSFQVETLPLISYLGDTDRFGGTENGGWTLNGNNPYLNSVDMTDNNIYSGIAGGTGRPEDYNGESASFGFGQMVTNATSVNSVTFTTYWKPDGSWCGQAFQANIYLWNKSNNAWILVDTLGGAGGGWRQFTVDVSTIMQDGSGNLTVDQINNMQVLFMLNTPPASGPVTWVGLSPYVNGYFSYTYVAVSYVTSGTQTTGEWFKANFQADTICGIYFECRGADDNDYARHYTIVTESATANPIIGSGYTTYDPSERNITAETLSGVSNTGIDFNSHPSDTAWNYKDYGIGGLSSFIHNFGFNVQSNYGVCSNYMAFIYAITNYVNTIYQQTENSQGFFSIALINNNNYNGPISNLFAGLAQLQDNQFLIQLVDENGPIQIQDPQYSSSYPYVIPYVFSYNVNYYIAVIKNINGIIVTIYSNSNMDFDSIIYSTSQFPYTGKLGNTFRYEFNCLTYGNYNWSQYISQQTTQTNVITNGNFSDGELDGSWTNSSDATIITVGGPANDPINPYSGNYMCDISSSSGALIGAYPLNSGGNTQVDFFLYINSANSQNWNFQVIIYYNDSGGNNHTINQQINAFAINSFSWQKIDLTQYVSGFGTSSAVVTGIMIESNSNEFYVGDVELVVQSNGQYQSLDSFNAYSQSPEVPNLSSIGIFEMEPNTNQNWFLETYIESSPNTFATPFGGQVSFNMNIKNTPSTSDISGYYECNYWSNSHIGSGWGSSGTLILNNSDGYLTHIASNPLPSPANWSDPAYYWTFTNINSKFKDASFTSPTFHIKGYLSGSGATSGAYAGITVYYSYSTDGINWSAWAAFPSNINLPFDAGDNQHDISIDASALTNNGLAAFNSVRIKLQMSGMSTPDNGNFTGSITIQDMGFALASGSTGYMGQIKVAKIFSEQNLGVAPTNDYGILGEVVLQATKSSTWLPIVVYTDASGVVHTVSSSTAISSSSLHSLSLQVLTGSGNGSITLIIDKQTVASITGITNNSYGSYGYPNSIDICAQTDAYTNISIYPKTGMPSGIDFSSISVYFLDENVSMNINLSSVTFGQTVLVPDTDNSETSGSGSYRDIIASWDPQYMNNIKIIITDDDLNQGWAITQVYIYLSPNLKYRVFVDNSDELPPAQSYTLDQLEIMGDVDGDGTIDQTDVTIMNAAMGSTPTSENWNKACDLNNDGVVNLLDMAILMSNMGKSCGFNGGPYIVGPVSVDANYDYVIGPLNLPRNRLLDVMYDVVKLCNDGWVPFEWWLEFNNNNTIHFSTRKGQDKYFDNWDGDDAKKVVFQTGVNIGSLKREMYSNDSVQRVYIVGEGEGLRQEVHSAWSEADGSVTDIPDGEADVKTIYEEVVHNKTCVNADMAADIGKVYLMTNNNCLHREQLSLVLSKDDYPSMYYDVGDSALVVDQMDDYGQVGGLNTDYRIMNIEKEVDAEAGEKISITLGFPNYRFNDEVTGIYQQLKLLNSVGLVADWTAEGDEQSQISQDNIGVKSTFSANAKNEETSMDKDMKDPLWYYAYSNWNTPRNGPNYPNMRGSCTFTDFNSNSTKNYQQMSGQNGQGWAKTSSWMELVGANSPSNTNNGMQSLIVSIEGNMDYTGNANGGNPFSISMYQNPMLTVEFKIEHGFCFINGMQYGDAQHIWNDGDFVLIGLANLAGTIGFWFKILCVEGNFIVQSQYSLDGATTITRNLRSVQAWRKYRLEIISDCQNNNLNDYSMGNGVANTVTLNIYDLGLDYVEPYPPSAVCTFTQSNSPQSVFVQPLYMQVTNNPYVGSSTDVYQAKMFIYSYKCQWMQTVVSATPSVTITPTGTLTYSLAQLNSSILTFNANAVGGQPDYSYMWYVGTTDNPQGVIVNYISGDSLVFNNNEGNVDPNSVTIQSGHTYQVWCVVSDYNGVVSRPSSPTTVVVTS